MATWYQTDFHSLRPGDIFTENPDSGVAFNKTVPGYDRKVYVPYLTFEQLESFGLQQCQSPTSVSYGMDLDLSKFRWYQYKHYYISFYENTRVLGILTMENAFTVCHKFSSVCNDINKFRQILTILEDDTKTNTIAYANQKESKDPPSQSWYEKHQEDHLKRLFNNPKENPIGDKETRS